MFVTKTSLMYCDEFEDSKGVFHHAFLYRGDSTTWYRRGNTKLHNEILVSVHMAVSTIFRHKGQVRLLDNHDCRHVEWYLTRRSK
jgi:hypothetical protein